MPWQCGTAAQWWAHPGLLGDRLRCAVGEASRWLCQGGAQGLVCSQRGEWSVERAGSRRDRTRAGARTLQGGSFLWRGLTGWAQGPRQCQDALQEQRAAPGRPGLWLTGKPGRSRTHSPGAHGPGGKRAGLPRPCFLLSHPSRSPAPHQPTGCRTSSDTSWGGQPGCPRGSSPSSVLPLPSLSLACWPLRLPACVGAQPRASLLPFLGGKAAGSGSAGLRPRAVPREPSGPALGALQCLQPPLCLWEES